MNIYYGCIIKKKPIVTDSRPENFENLPFCKAFTAPNIVRAASIYEVDLKLMKAQKGK